MAQESGFPKCGSPSQPHAQIEDILEDSTELFGTLLKYLRAQSAGACGFA